MDNTPSGVPGDAREEGRPSNLPEKFLLTVGCAAGRERQTASLSSALRCRFVLEECHVGQRQDKSGTLERRAVLHRYRFGQDLEEKLTSGLVAWLAAGGCRRRATSEEHDP